MTNDEQRQQGREAGRIHLQDQSPLRLQRILDDINYQDAPYVQGLREILLARVICADCGAKHNPHKLPSHECKEQRAANRKAQRGMR